ncbi:Vitamin D3 dihydroxylase [Streptomyces sp. enrichment culture]
MTEMAIQETAAEYPAFPMQRADPLGPPELYAELREREPISRIRMSVTGQEAWLVTRYDHYRELIRDPRVSADMYADNYPRQIPVPLELLRSVPRTIFHLDAPDHTVHRRLLTPEFTYRRIEGMRERTQQIADEYVDRLLEKGGPVDLMAELSLPMPSQAMCELLGIPPADRHIYHEWITLLIGTDTTPEQHAQAEITVVGHLEKLIAQKTEHPEDDLLSRLIARNNEEKLVSDRDVLNLARSLIAGSHETSANMITLSVLALLRNPEQLALLKADPSLDASAADEMLRYFSVSDAGTSRVVLEDIELGDVVLRKGEGVVASILAANHDPEVFTDPGRIDITRSPNNHVAFGTGIHQCIGHLVVKMQLGIVLGTLFRRIPDLRLAIDLDDVKFKNAAIRGVEALPVTW